MGKPAWRLEPGASRQSHKRQRLCKHCAASVRRKNCPSLRFYRKESLDQFLEARLAAQRVEPLVGLEAAVIALKEDSALVEALLEQLQRFLFLTQGKVDDSERKGIELMRTPKLGDGFGESTFALQAFSIPLMGGGIVWIELQGPAKLRLGRAQLHIKQQGVCQGGVCFGQATIEFHGFTRSGQ